MKLYNLFYKCAYTIEYETIGEDVNYAFEERNDTLYIFFQGSNSITDWIFNFLFTKKIYKQFRVHRGFYRAYSQVRDVLLDKIYNGNYESIVVVGYSHGASLCQLAVEDIKYHFPNMKLLGYAFESPRCLKVPRKLRYYWKDLTMIRNGCDLITHLPPKIFGFNDLGKCLKIKGNTKLVKKRVPKCIKYHYPQCVLDGLEKYEEILSEKNKKKRKMAECNKY